MAYHRRPLGLALAAALFAGLVGVAPAVAADEPAGGVAGFLAGFDLGLGVGATAFTDVVDDVLVTTTYQKVSLSPDLAFGKFGLGLDITLHVNFSGGPTGDKYVRTEDWVPASFQDPAAELGEKLTDLGELYLGKFRYIRWGLRGEPLYIKFGMIEDGSLGNGFLMGDYSNTMYLPGTRILGLALGVDGSLFKFPLLGLETFVGNLARFDVFGGRVYVRPLSLTGVPILKNLSVGVTGALDRDPYLYGDGDPDLVLPAASPVVALGLDLQQPILSSPLLSLAAFADWGMLMSSTAGGSVNGMGAMVGAGGKLIGFLTYGAQIRMIGPRFVPVYFDSTYDLDRAAKYQTLTADAADIAAAWYAQWVASIGASFMDDNILFRISASGPFVPPVDIGGVALDNSELSAPQVKGLAKVEGDFLRGFSFVASYDKKDLDTTSFGNLVRDLVSPLDALIQARVNYKTGPAVISFVYNLKYLPEPVLDDQGVERRWEITSGLETSIQLF
jgi:hypothetical protein